MAKRTQPIERRKYEWRPGGPRPAVDAEIVGREVERLGGATQTVQVDSFVDAARVTASPLHGLFEWNDSTAAEHYRKQQARQILASLVITIVQTSTNESRSTRAFLIARPEGEERSYVSTERITGDRDLQRQVVGSAHRELLNFIRRFEHIAALAPRMPHLKAEADAMRDIADQLKTDAGRRSTPRTSPVDTEEAAVTTA